MPLVNAASAVPGDFRAGISLVPICPWVKSRFAVTSVQSSTDRYAQLLLVPVPLQRRALGFIGRLP